MAVAIKKINGIPRSSIKKVGGKTIIGGNEIASMPLAVDANTIAYWRMEGNSLDETAGNYDGSDTSMSYGANYGKFGQGAYFSGSGIIAITDAAALKPTTAFSVAFWAKRDTDGVDANVFASFSANTNYAGIRLGFGNSHSKLSLVLGKNTGTTENTDYKRFYSLSDAYTTAWRHWVCTYDGTNVKFYLNGVADGSTANTMNPAYAATNYVRIGGARQSTIEVWLYRGSLDEILFTNDALTATEISNIYNTQIKKFMGINNV